MKIEFTREPFQRAFQAAALVAPSRSAKPILQNIRVDAEPGQVHLTATDSETGIRLEVGDVTVHQAGSVVLPVGRLGMILRENTDEQLKIEAGNGKALVQGSHSRFELQTAAPEEFPEVGGFTPVSWHELPAAALRELIRRTIFATDAESTRYALSGILLEFEDGVVNAVATDGRRMARMASPVRAVGKPETGGGTTIVPARSMQLIERILPEGDTDVRLAVRANDLLLGIPGGVFTTRLVEGRFPRWREAIPKRTSSHRIDLPVGPLYAALRQAAVVASEESRGIDFAFSTGSLVLSSATAEVGESRVDLPVAFEGQDLTIRLDNRYVGDFLRVLPPDRTFTLDVENSQAAAFCSTDDQYGYVIMPLQRG